MEQLIEDTLTIGKPQWRAMLRYTAELHARSVRPARAPFPYDWEEIGPGYCYGPAFGHWDIVHAILDVMPSQPEHARRQILNNLAAQEDSGLVPGVIYMRNDEPRWSHEFSHPPFWPIAVQDFSVLSGSDELIQRCYQPLVNQIRWFEANRAAQEGGFFYRDILTFQWESGVDEGVRFFQAQPGPHTCVDATAHLYGVYEHAAAWARTLGQPGSEWVEKAAALKDLIQTRLWDETSGWFYDIWSVDQPAGGSTSAERHLAFEGMFPLLMGAASPAQARRAIEENLLNPRRFYSPHPISTVGIEDPLFELRMWRGPAWNSMTYWAARACLRYEEYARIEDSHDSFPFPSREGGQGVRFSSSPSFFSSSARALLGPALDDSAAQFTRTGTIWEFYNSLGGHPEDVQRKPHTPFNQPCRDYLGHNPLIAMARLYDLTETQASIP
jgi:glycogen debranching enzyme